MSILSFDCKHPVGGRILAESLIIDQPEKWNLFFSKMYWNLRQVWGKLYSGKVAAARYDVEKRNLLFRRKLRADQNINCVMKRAPVYQIKENTILIRYYSALDDFYETSFFEEMLCFMEENQLEMAACGTEFFEEESGCVFNVFSAL